MEANQTRQLIRRRYSVSNVTFCSFRLRVESLAVATANACKEGCRSGQFRSLCWTQLTSSVEEGSSTRTIDVSVLYVSSKKCAFVEADTWCDDFNVDNDTQKCPSFFLCSVSGFLCGMVMAGEDGV